MSTEIKINGRRVDKEEEPLKWHAAYIGGMLVAGLGLVLASMLIAIASLLLVVSVVTLLVFVVVAMPLMVVLDGIIWLFTREHYFVHHEDEKFAIGWKKGSKYQEE